jgi:hypothetical protein
MNSRFYWAEIVTLNMIVVTAWETTECMTRKWNQGNYAIYFGNNKLALVTVTPFPSG